MPSPTLTSLLEPFAPFFANPKIEEIIVNAPSEVWVWHSGAFQRHEVDLDADDITDIGIVAGAQRRQDVGAESPLLSTDLQGMGRLQVVLPPCVQEGHPALVIRRGDNFSPTISDLSASGLFKRTKRQQGGQTDEGRALLDLYRAEDWERFFPAAVLARKTVVICGETASGKTTVAKGLINAIPLHERLITIEDTPEWTNLPHPNVVHLFYSKGGKQYAGVDPRELVEAALRMRIGRLLVQELRDGVAAFGFLRALASGHPGGITTVHAASAGEAFKAIGVMLKEVGGNMSEDDVQEMLHTRIDIVIHCERKGQDFGISEVWYGPGMAAEP